jgi:hypothetical protein
MKDRKKGEERKRNGVGEQRRRGGESRIYFFPFLVLLTQEMAAWFS